MDPITLTLIATAIGIGGNEAYETFTADPTCEVHVVKRVNSVEHGELEVPLCFTKAEIDNLIKESKPLPLN
jgi:hypothetical protein